MAKIKLSKIILGYFSRKDGKLGPYGPELILHFGTQLAKNTQLSRSGPYAKAHQV